MGKVQKEIVDAIQKVENKVEQWLGVLKAKIDNVEHNMKQVQENALVLEQTEMQ